MLEAEEMIRKLRKDARKKFIIKEEISQDIAKVALRETLRVHRCTST